MADKKVVELEPSREANTNLKELAKRARRINDRFASQGRRFSDSTQTVRTDRDTR
ncbi:MAG: hypothetical protein M3494_15080 [Actinomycetota bacterium]|jgi:hypothetical protein|nr:hypothetical protein [Actinomycetota bacterium]